MDEFNGMYSTKGVEHLTSNDKDTLIIKSQLASLIGLNESIVFQQIKYWIDRNPHEREGRLWIYNTYQEWLKQFPFFSLRTLGRIIKSLEELLLIIPGNFNYDKTNRKKWYTIDMNRLREIEKAKMANSKSPFGQNGQLYREGQNGCFHSAKMANCTYTENNYTENTTENNNARERAISFSNELISKEIEVKSNQEASKSLTTIHNSFEMFWAVYPVKKSKSKARESFLKAIKRTDLNAMLEAIKGQGLERDQKTSLGVFAPEWPHPTTWLNQRRWEDEIELLDSIQKRQVRIGAKSFKERDLELRSQAIPTLAEKLEMQESLDKAFEGGIRYRDE